MTTQLFKNNAASTLATPVTVGGTSISLQVGHGSHFPAPTGSDYFLVTLFEKDGTGTEFNYEIVKVTARSGDVFTAISRDYEGTAGAGGGSAYPSAVGSNPSGVTYVQLRHTAYAAGNTLNKDGNLSGLASPSTALSNLGAQASVTATGILKGSGAGSVGAATVRTDYAEPTTALATGILKNTTTTGAHTIAVAGTDYSAGTNALATGILKSTTSTGALTIAVAGTDFQSPIGTISGIVKGNGANALTAATAGTDFVSPTTLNNSTLPASLTDVGLSSISKSIHYGAIVKAIIYDTSKDSDGGAWRKRCTDKSWYTETLGGTSWIGQYSSVATAWAGAGSVTGAVYQSTADGKFYTPTSASTQTEVFRGISREFPQQVAIVAESNRVVIYDLTQTGTPMWMSLFSASGYWTYGSLTSLAAANGLLVTTSGTATGGLSRMDFIKDQGYLNITSTNVYNLTNVAQRNTARGDVISGAWAVSIVNRQVNDVALTVLDNAPIDPATGLPVPTIAIATAGGVSVIKDDGTVVNSAGVLNYTRLSIDPSRRIWYTDTANGVVYVSTLPVSSIAAGWAISRAYYGSAGSVPATIPTGSFSGAYGATQEQNYTAFNSGLGVTLLKENPTTPTSGMVAYVTNAYNSGWQVGAIKGAYLADTTAETITASGELVTNGTFTTDTSGWTALNGATLAVVSGELQVTSTGGANSGCSRAITCVIGRSYILSSTMRRGTCVQAVKVDISGLTALSNATTSNTDSNLTFIATATTHIVEAFINGAAAASETAYFDNISVKLADPDRSVKNKGLVVNGSLTKTAVATGAGLVAYSGFSA